MNLSPEQNKNCLRENIAAYLDGELSPHEEILLEKHLASCPSCLAEMNSQKQMFSAFDAAFNDKTEIELPENFAKVVATRAETSVKGLRAKKERRRALFFCAVLFTLIIFGLNFNSAICSFEKFSERLMTVVWFIGHLAYDLGIGLTIILRSIGNQPSVNSTLILLSIIGVFIFPAIVLSRYFYNSNRF